jgi:hypothetical protein
MILLMINLHSGKQRVTRFRFSFFRHCRICFLGPLHLRDVAPDVGPGTKDLLRVVVQPVRLPRHLRQCLRGGCAIKLFGPRRRTKLERFPWLGFFMACEPTQASICGVTLRP